ncbi:glycosyltransferase family protein [Polluticoccus soli]|uniref:glycosyltransferase family protein n=1 Tax=Polluticoccus soli TaxID=3034150 RepID=UPI0023E2498E|nr:glycosyltransferase family protein [Flavipsychrobacter sp. JY13-12]
MKILFAIQGTGNGHLSRARDIYPELAKYGEVDVLISGIQADVELPYPVKYKYYGMSFIFGKNGGVDIWATARKLRLRKLIRDIKQLPVEDYDLVINDFEPVSAWACKLKNKPCISLSHQCAVLNPHAPMPEHADLMGTLVLKRYAPVTAAYGFHFQSYDKNIFTPVIRREIRELQPTDEGHYTVYLPAYDDNTLCEHLSKFPEANWQVFSKHNKGAYTLKNVRIMPIDNDAFIRSMASSTGVLCGAGFEGPAEALHLGKKLMVIPMQTQYEQQCNAAALKEMGVPVIRSLSKKYHEDIRQWLLNNERVRVSYPDMTTQIVRKVVATHAVLNATPEAAFA